MTGEPDDDSPPSQQTAMGFDVHYMKPLILIAGGPGAGKSTLAGMLSRQYSARVRSTDELARLPWQEQSETVAGWLLAGTDPYVSTGPDIVEGVRVLSGLRKALARTTPGNLPIAQVVFLHGAYRELAPQARRLADRLAAEWPGLHAQLRLAGFETAEVFQTGAVSRYAGIGETSRSYV